MITSFVSELAQTGRGRALPPQSAQNCRLGAVPGHPGLTGTPRRSWTPAPSRNPGLLVLLLPRPRGYHCARGAKQEPGTGWAWVSFFSLCSPLGLFFKRKGAATSQPMTHLLMGFVRLEGFLILTGRVRAYLEGWVSTQTLPVTLRCWWLHHWNSEHPFPSLHS